MKIRRSRHSRTGRLLRRLTRIVLNRRNRATVRSQINRRIDRNRKTVRSRISRSRTDLRQISLRRIELRTSLTINRKRGLRRPTIVLRTIARKTTVRKRIGRM
jgi:hypothetical protein